MMLPIAFISWIPMLAELPTDPAQRTGYLIGVVIGIVIFLSIPVFGIISIIKAFTRRTAGWIVAGTISGLCLAAWCTLFVIGFVHGFQKGLAKSRQRAAARSGSQQLITGQVVAYTIEMPGGWTARRYVGGYDSVLSDGRGYVGVIASKATSASKDALAQSVRQHLQSTSPGMAFGENRSVEIDGHPFIAFTAQARVQNTPYTYQYYVYSGNEGTIELVGWAPQSIWESEWSMLDPIMHALHLP